MRGDGRRGPLLPGGAARRPGHESAGEAPGDVALRVDTGELDAVVAPLLDTSVTVIVGFTERDATGDLYSAAAVLRHGRVDAVHRKSYPGSWTAIRAGRELPVHRSGPSSFGIVICNDLWYPEPVRVLAASGAAVVFVPTHSGHPAAVTPAFRARGENLPVARAVDNTTTIVVADVAGRRDGRVAHGFTAVVDPDGRVVARGSRWCRRCSSPRSRGAGDASTRAAGTGTPTPRYGRGSRACGTSSTLRSGQLEREPTHDHPAVGHARPDPT